MDHAQPLPIHGEAVRQIENHSHRPASSTGSQYRDEGFKSIAVTCATSLHASLSTLLLNEKFSDMTIRCGEREFKAHRAVVCTQSSFFDRAFSHNFKEATSGVIELAEDDPDILERFLEFLYTGTYSDGVICNSKRPSSAAMMSPDEIEHALEKQPGVHYPDSELPTEPETLASEEECDDEDDDSVSPFPDPEEEPEEEYAEFGEPVSGNDLRPLAFEKEPISEVNTWLEDGKALRVLADIRNDLFLPLRLYIMADKYDVPALRLLSRDRFYRAAELTWVDTDCFPEVVDELYSNTCSSNVALRDIVCRLVSSRLRDDDIRERIKPVMAKHGEFAIGVLEYYLHRTQVTWT